MYISAYNLLVLIQKTNMRFEFYVLIITYGFELWCFSASFRGFAVTGLHTATL